MTKRERLLAILVGCLLVIALVSFVGNRLAGGFQTRQDRIAQLEDQIRQKELMIRRGQRATERLTDYERQSLPPNIELAGSLYRAHLLEMITKTELSQGNVKMAEPRTYRDLYHELQFTVTAKGSLDQVTRFLYEFYSSDYLHRARSLSLKPSEGGRELELTLIIEGLALQTAPPAQKLAPHPSNRLASDSVDEYLQTIVQRNVFSPANKAPNLALPTLPPLYKGRAASIKLAASDPDPGQTLTYELDHPEAPQGVNLNKQTGELQVTPAETGPLELVVRVTDNGVPPQSAKTSLRLQVQDPPPENIAEQFDKAKFTFLTGITEVEGRSQVWLNIRPDGKMLKLFEGDSFEVGALRGIVTRIGQRDVELQLDGKPTTLRLGQTLADGRTAS